MDTEKPRGGYLKGRLTAPFVRAVYAPGKYHDGAGMGLMLRVMASGSRQWVQRLSFNGKRIEIGLGSPPVVSLSEAREKAIDNKRLVYNGHNPVAQRAAFAAVPTFEEAAAAAVIVHSQGKAANYDVRFMGGLNLHIFPHIGGAKVNTITAADLNVILEPLILKTPGVARKVIDHTSVVFNWCVGKGHIENSPMGKAKEFLPKISASGKHRAFLPYTEVNGLLQDLHGCGAGEFTKLGIEFLILTAGRSIEIRGALWDEIDVLCETWTIPKERMKKGKREHVVYLSDRATEILVEARNLQNGLRPAGLIFPSPTGKMFSDMTFSKLVKQSLGYPVDIHGFRTSFRTWTQEKTKFSEEVCELALSHKFGDETRDAYARSPLAKERRLLMQAWADYLKIPSSDHKKRGESDLPDL